jgi:hypothetical protein
MALPSASLPTSASYLRWLLITVALGAAAVMAFVAVVDPYGLYADGGAPAAWHAVKPGLSRYQDEIKQSQAAALAPAILIQGNSRAEIGLDPDGPALSGVPGSAYNLAVSGSSIAVAHGQLAYLLHRGQRPKMLVLGVEFLDFIDAPGSSAGADIVPSPVAAPSPSGRGFWRFDSLFSLRALEDAWRTLRIQHEADAETMTAHGFNPLHEYRAMARSEGYYALFRQRAQENARVYLRKAGGRPSAADAAHLAALLRLAAGAGIEVKLLIYPYHAQILALFEQAGLWPAFEAWKGTLVGEVAAVRLAYPAARVALFDFSGYWPFNCEPIPEKGDVVSETRWYWEGGHFKSALGETVLERVLSSRLPSSLAGNDATAGFGFMLEPGPASAAANRRRIAAGRALCFSAYPSLFHDSAALVAAARPH